MKTIRITTIRSCKQVFSVQQCTNEVWLPLGLVSAARRADCRPSESNLSYVSLSKWGSRSGTDWRKLDDVLSETCRPFNGWYISPVSCNQTKKKRLMLIMNVRYAHDKWLFDSKLNQILRPRMDYLFYLLIKWLEFWGNQEKLSV